MTVTAAADLSNDDGVDMRDQRDDDAIGEMLCAQLAPAGVNTTWALYADAPSQR